MTELRQIQMLAWDSGVTERIYVAVNRLNWRVTETHDLYRKQMKHALRRYRHMLPRGKCFGRMKMILCIDKARGAK